jgi:hypothetical protein
MAQCMRGEMLDSELVDVLRKPNINRIAAEMEPNEGTTEDIPIGTRLAPDDFQRLPGQHDEVLLLVLGLLCGQCPDAFIDVDFINRELVQISTKYSGVVSFGKVD